MSKISVVVKLTAQDGKRGDLIAGMDAMMDHVESEEGTLKYIIMEDSKDENVAWMYEEYTDQASFEAHGSSDAMKALGAAIGPFMGAAPELTFCKPGRGKGL